MSVKWPEKKIENAHYYEYIQHFHEAKAWNAAIEACIKAVEDAKEPKVTVEELLKLVDSCKFESGIQTEEYSLIYPKLLAQRLFNRLNQ